MAAAGQEQAGEADAEQGERARLGDGSDGTTFLLDEPQCVNSHASVAMSGN